MIQQIVDVLALGGTYSLLALGLAVVYNMLGFVHFAYGEQITIGAYALFLAEGVGLPWSISALIAIAAAIAGAVAMERIAFRPMRGASPNSLLLTSFLLSVGIQALLAAVISSRAQSVTIPPLLTTVVRFGTLTVSTVDMLTLGTSVVVLASLVVVFRLTDFGITIRAAASDFGMARLCGVKADAIIARAFALSGFLTGIACLLLTARLGLVSPSMGLIPMLKAFIAASIGGLGSLGGAAAGGFVLGALESVSADMLPTEWLPYADAVSIGGVVVILLLRPGGLFAPSSK